jgi:hypothetical protein
MSVVFCLSICTATANNFTVGNEKFLLGCTFYFIVFFLRGGGCAEMMDTSKKVGLQLSAWEMKVCS